jgi:adenylate kinase family enzyme
MRVLIFGNSGSGKSHYAIGLAREYGLARLDLDTVVWEPGQIAVGRPYGEALSDLRQFIDEHEDWVIEGCYGDLIEYALPRCTELVFMNPGKEACLRNNARRPWERHKYASMEAQQSMLPVLTNWVGMYYERSDNCSYVWHRSVYDGFEGSKREITALEERP